jgi:3-hydroxybutyryl-CoA dehydratase
VIQEIAHFEISELSIGQSFSYEKVIDPKMVDSFSSLVGDVSPLHMDDHFAARRGFSGRVVHGALIIGLVSTLVGVYFPGKNALVLSIKFHFLSPSYLNDCLVITGIVDQISLSTNVVVLRIEIADKSTGTLRAKGHVNVGFTKENCR